MRPTMRLISAPFAILDATSSGSPTATSRSLGSALSARQHALYRLSPDDRGDTAGIRCRLGPALRHAGHLPLSGRCRYPVPDGKAIGHRPRRRGRSRTAGRRERRLRRSGSRPGGRSSELHAVYTREGSTSWSKLRSRGGRGQSHGDGNLYRTAAGWLSWVRVSGQLVGMAVDQPPSLALQSEGLGDAQFHDG